MAILSVRCDACGKRRPYWWARRVWPVVGGIAGWFDFCSERCQARGRVDTQVSMCHTHAMTTSTDLIPLTITCDMATDLWHAGLGPRFSDQYQTAEEADDIETMERLDNEQLALVERYGAMWSRAAVDIGAQRGYAVTPVLAPSEMSRDAIRAANWLRLGLDTDETDEIVRSIWQAAHDAISVE